MAIGISEKGSNQPNENGILKRENTNEYLNVVLAIGSNQEANRDFTSIVEMHASFLNHGLMDGQEFDNGLAWLVHQQGYSLQELKQALLDLDAKGIAFCEEKHGIFLSSVATELNDFPCRKGLVVVLAKMTSHDAAQLAMNTASITMPATSTVGLFNPWDAQNGAALAIRLEKPLTIPWNMQRDMCVDSEKANSAYPIQQLYELPDSAWRPPLEIKPNFLSKVVFSLPFLPITLLQAENNDWRVAMAQQVPIPKMDFSSEQSASEIIISFYQDLGWNLRDTVDPKQIVINNQQWQDICDEFNKLPREPGEAPNGFAWMNSGPSASADVPYGKVRIEARAFTHFQEGLTSTDRKIIDDAVHERNHVTDGVIRLEAEYHDNIDGLLQRAYDSRNKPPEDIQTDLLVKIDGVWMDTVESVIDDAVAQAGFEPDNLNYENARQYVIDTYLIDIPYDYYLSQPVPVNIILGTKAEANLDFSSIASFAENRSNVKVLDADVRDNALTWLIKQQGHTLNELKDASSIFQKWGFDAAEITQGTFLASVVEELHNFNHEMGAVTVLTNMSLYEFIQMQEPGASVTVPRYATVGLFSPWVGGGSQMDITLEEPLTIPSDMRFDVQIEGAKCQEYTINEVYGLMPAAWKNAVSVDGPIQKTQTKPLDEQIKTAKERAAEKNLCHPDQTKSRNHPELEI